MKNPSVSIIMSTYNNEAYIAKSLESVLWQSFTDWECIVINDCSTDKTERIIKQYSQLDTRIKCYTNKKNKGLVANLIKGVALSKGKYIARIDGDDVWIDKNKLHKQFEFLNSHPKFGLVGTFANIIDTEENKILETKNPVTDAEIRNYILIENCFFHSSIMMRKSVYKKVGGYDESLKATEDYDLWLKIGLVSNMYTIPEYLINYRSNPEGINATKYTYQLKETINVVKKFKSSYPNYKIGLFLWYLRKYVPKNIKTFASGIMKSKYALAGLRQTKRIILSFHS